MCPSILLDFKASPLLLKVPIGFSEGCPGDFSAFFLFPCNLRTSSPVIVGSTWSNCSEGFEGWRTILGGASMWEKSPLTNTSIGSCVSLPGLSEFSVNFLGRKGLSEGRWFPLPKVRGGLSKFPFDCLFSGVTADSVWEFFSGREFSVLGVCMLWDSKKCGFAAFCWLRFAGCSDPFRDGRFDFSQFSARCWLLCFGAETGGGGRGKTSPLLGECKSISPFFVLYWPADSIWGVEGSPGLKNGGEGGPGLNPNSMGFPKRGYTLGLNAQYWFCWWAGSTPSSQPNFKAHTSQISIANQMHIGFWD